MAGKLAAGWRANDNRKPLYLSMRSTLRFPYSRHFACPYPRPRIFLSLFRPFFKSGYSFRGTDL